MADNIDVTEGAGKTVRTDDVGGIQYQYVKPDMGGDGVADPLVKGQAIKANSVPVTLASDEDTVPVNADGNIGQQAKAASLPVTLANDEDTVPVEQQTAVDIEVNANIGQQTKAASLPVTLASDEDTVPVNADGNIGQQTKAASLPVTLASDENDVEVVQPTHDDLNANANIQVGDADVAVGNPVPVAGTAAKDAAAAGNPAQVGGVYKTMVSGDDVDTGDVAPILLDPTGALVIGRHGNAFNTSDNWGAAQTATEIEATPGAGLSIHVKTLTISSDGTLAGNIFLHDEDDAVITEKLYFPATAGMFSVTFDPPRKLTANKALEVTSIGATNLSVMVDGYIAP